MERTGTHKVQGRGRVSVSHKQVHLARVLNCLRAVADGSRYATPSGVIAMVFVALLSVVSLSAHDAESRAAGSSVLPLTFDEAKALQLTARQDPAYLVYARSVGKVISLMEVPKRLHCERIRVKGKVEVFFLIGADGKVVEAYARSKDARKAECVRQSFIGMVANPPPFSPLPIGVTYGKD
jgi:hypothetical protein